MIVFTPIYILKFLSNYNENDSSLSKFIEKYEEIIKIDKKKPLFSLTERYSTFPKQQFDNRQYIKMIEKGKNAWKPDKNNKDIEKVIKGLLNKISDKNYKICCTTLVSELLKNTSFEIFDIIIEEIIEKCIYDVKYHNIFIELCRSIWSNKQIHYNLITIKEIDGQLYWSKNTTVVIEYGPFANKSDLNDDIMENIFFKSLLLEKFHNKFLEREHVFETIDSDGDAQYKKKRKIQSIIEFIIKLYFKKHINDVPLCFIFDNYANTKLYKEDIECLYNISKIFNNKFPKLKIYLRKINGNIKNEKWDSRTNFFLSELMRVDPVSQNIHIGTNMPTFAMVSSMSVSNFNNANINNEELIKKFINKNITMNNICDLLKQPGNVCETVIYCYFDDNKNLDKYINLITTMYKKKYIYRKEIINSFYSILKNYNDNIINYPKIYLYFSELVNGISNKLNITFCNNKMVSNIKDNISDFKKRAKLSVSILNHCDRITDSAFQKLLQCVNNASTACQQCVNECKPNT